MTCWLLRYRSQEVRWDEDERIGGALVNHHQHSLAYFEMGGWRGRDAEANELELRDGDINWNAMTLEDRAEVEATLRAFWGGQLQDASEEYALRVVRERLADITAARVGRGTSSGVLADRHVGHTWREVEATFKRISGTHLYLNAQPRERYPMTAEGLRDWQRAQYGGSDEDAQP